MDAQNIASLNKLMLKSITMGFGYQVMPLDINDTSTYNAQNGTFFCAFKAVNGDAVISTATDLQGNTVLTNVTITEGDVLYFPIDTFQPASGRIIAYKALLLDAELV